MLFAAGNAVAVAILANAGVAKLVSPMPFRRALGEVAPRIGNQVGRATVRLVASVELIAALGLLAFAARSWAAMVVAALGSCFAVLGTIGWLRRSSVPCGCLGVENERPLGPTNVALGAALISLVPLNGYASVDAHYTIWATLLASIGSVVLCLWLKRRLVAGLLVPKRAVAGGSEVR
jgi:hypothetical protein